jgi:hypothetical protein
MTWRASGVPLGGTLRIQRRVGTAGAWRTAVNLSAGKRDGTEQLRPLTLGSYPIRLAAFDSKHKLLAARTRTLTVFGRVPFSQLFASNGNSPGSYAGPTFTFDYVLLKLASEDDTTSALRVANSPCRRVHIDFVVKQERNYSFSGTAVLVQAAADPVSTTADPDTVASVEATTGYGRSWALNMTYQGAAAPRGWASFMFNGWGECSAATSLLPS